MKILQLLIILLTSSVYSNEQAVKFCPKWIINIPSDAKATKTKHGYQIEIKGLPGSFHVVEVTFSRKDITLSKHIDTWPESDLIKRRCTTTNESIISTEFLNGRSIEYYDKEYDNFKTWLFPTDNAFIWIIYGSKQEINKSHHNTLKMLISNIKPNNH